MASPTQLTNMAPTNFYLCNPLALLLEVDSKNILKTDDQVQNPFRTRTEGSFKDASDKLGADIKDRALQRFLADTSVAKQYLIELNQLLEASQINDQKGDSRNEDSGKTE